MDKKARYKLAGIVFAALLVIRLYSLGKFFWIWITKDAYQAWLSLGVRELSVFWFVARIACVVCVLYPLIALTISAFHEKTNQKKKKLYAWLYCVGMLLPWAQSLSSSLRFLGMVFKTSHLIVFFRVLFQQCKPVVFVLLFLFALYKLMQTESEGKAAAAVGKTEEKVKYYRDLMNQGVITEEEFRTMEEKIRRGEL